MSRALAVAVLVTALLPEQCNALLAKSRSASADAPASPAPRPSARAPTNDPTPAPTAPPVWMPPAAPVPVTPVAHADALDAGHSADAGKPSPELRKALAAFDAGEHKRVRALLEKKVKAGKGTAEEARLVASSCAAMNDKVCVEAIRPLVGE